MGGVGGSLGASRRRLLAPFPSLFMTLENIRGRGSGQVRPRAGFSESDGVTSIFEESSVAIFKAVGMISHKNLRLDWADVRLNGTTSDS